MFQRYTERARRVIFFARYEAAQTGSTAIETEHMLLGLMREDVNLFHQMPVKDVNALRTELFGQPPSLPTSTSVDLPLTASAKRALKHAESEASALEHRHIGTEHLLLGVLRESDSTAARILQKYGITREQILGKMPKGYPPDTETPLWAPPGRNELHALLDRVPEAALPSVKGMLERIAAGFLPTANASQARSEGVGWNFPPPGNLPAAGGTRQEEEAWVSESHHKFAGHSIKVIQRFQLSDDQKTLTVAYEIRGPKGEHHGKAELDVS